MNSKGEARRAINNKGIKINDSLIDNENKKIKITDCGEKNSMKISFGQKRNILL